MSKKKLVFLTTRPKLPVRVILAPAVLLSKKLRRKAFCNRAPAIKATQCL